MCGSDVAQLHGHHHVPGEVAPVVPGHEIVGRIDALAPDADLGVAVGDRVAVEIIVPTTPSPAHPHGILAGYSYTLGTDHEHGLWGGYGEYMGLLPGTLLHKLTDTIPATELTLFEGLASAVNWVDVADVQPGDTVVVQGPGHMGHVCVVMAKLRGAGRVIVTGTAKDAARFEIARRVGADLCLDGEAEDVVARVREATGGRGARVVMDMAAMATSTLPEAIEMAAHGGHVLVGGLKNERPVEIVSDHLVFKSLTLHGGLRLDPRVLRRGLRAAERGRIPTKPLLGTTCTLDELDRAMALLERQVPDEDVVRVVLEHP